MTDADRGADMGENLHALSEGLSLRFWNQLKTPPLEALKLIRGGRLSGFHDISPAWRMRAMTKVFGPCGLGWRYRVSRREETPGPDGQLLLRVSVEVSYRDLDREGEAAHAGGTTPGPIWSEPIEATGSSFLIAKEKSGLRMNEEAEKMAITDATGKALMALGVGADVYMGLFDSKHHDVAPEDRQTRSGKPRGPSMVGKFYQALTRDFGEGHPKTISGKRKMAKAIFGHARFDEIRDMPNEAISEALEDSDTGYAATLPRVQEELADLARGDGEGETP